MIIPSVMIIEIAIDMLKEVPQDLRDAQIRELMTLGDGRIEKMGVSGFTPDFEKGYELGLQVARTMLMMNVRAVQAKVTI